MSEQHRARRLYAALDYMGEAQAALEEASESLLAAECNANAGGDEQLTREAEILKRAVSAEADGVKQSIRRARERRSKR